MHKLPVTEVRVSDTKGMMGQDDRTAKHLVFAITFNHVPFARFTFN
jgi:hypothetical protein